MRRRVPRSAVVALSLAGCSLLQPADLSVTAALLDKVPAELPRVQRRPVVLLVQVPEARAAVDTVRMAYSLRPHHLAYYAKNEWAETPPQMLRPLLLRTFDAGGCCNAVVAPPYAGHYDYALRTEVLALVQDFSQEPPQLRLALRVQLAAGERVIATHELAFTQAMAQKAPEAGVAAANEAVARSLREIADRVVPQLR